MKNKFEKYNLYVKVIHDDIHIITNKDSIEILAQFLDYWNDAQGIREELLNELKMVIEGQIPYSDIGADVVGFAVAKSLVTRLAESEIGYDDLELSTIDFRDLLIEWSEHLEFFNENGKIKENRNK